MLPDMSAKVSFLAHKLAPREMKPRLAAGQSALINRNGGTFAYLLEGNRIRETPVRVGATFGDMVEIHPSPFTENPACWLETGTSYQASIRFFTPSRPEPLGERALHVVTFVLPCDQ